MDGDTVEICGEAPLAGPSSPWGIGATLAGSRTALTQLRLSASRTLGGGAAAAAVTPPQGGDASGASASPSPPSPPPVKEGGGLLLLTLAGDVFGGRSLEFEATRGPEGHQSLLSATAMAVPAFEGGGASEDGSSGGGGGSGFAGVAWGVSLARPLGRRLTAFARFFQEPDAGGRQLAVQAVARLTERDSLSALYAANMGADYSGGLAFTRKLGASRREELSLRALAARSGGSTLSLSIKVHLRLV